MHGHVRGPAHATVAMNLPLTNLENAIRSCVPLLRQWEPAVEKTGSPRHTRVALCHDLSSPLPYCDTVLRRTGSGCFGVIGVAPSRNMVTRLTLTRNRRGLAQLRH